MKQNCRIQRSKIVKTNKKMCFTTKEPMPEATAAVAPTARIIGLSTTIATPATQAPAAVATPNVMVLILLNVLASSSARCCLSRASASSDRALSSLWLFLSFFGIISF